MRKNNNKRKRIASRAHEYAQFNAQRKRAYERAMLIAQQWAKINSDDTRFALDPALNTVRRQMNDAKVRWLVMHLADTIVWGKADKLWTVVYENFEEWFLDYSHFTAGFFPPLPPVKK
jgi:hypothetical protein